MSKTKLLSLQCIRSFDQLEVSLQLAATGNSIEFIKLHIFDSNHYLFIKIVFKKF